MEYTASEPFQGEDYESLRLYVSDNLLAIENEINQVKQLHFVKWSKVPDKYVNGDVYYFYSGVLYPGQTEGLFIWIDPQWRQLNYRESPAATMGAVTPTDITVIDENQTLVNQFDAIGLEDHVDADLANDSIIIESSGRYSVNGRLSFLNQTNNTDWRLSLAVDGVASSIIFDSASSRSIDDSVSLSISATNDLIAGQVLTLVIEKVGSGTDVIPVKAAYFSVVRQ